MANPDPISAFDGKTISYTYDNGCSFTNTFDCHLRISHVPRCELREHDEMIELRDGLFFASWIDDEMGLLAQIIDTAPPDSEIYRAARERMEQISDG